MDHGHIGHPCLQGNFQGLIDFYEQEQWSIEIEVSLTETRQ